VWIMFDAMEGSDQLLSNSLPHDTDGEFSVVRNDVFSVENQS